MTDRRTAGRVSYGRQPVGVTKGQLGTLESTVGQRRKGRMVQIDDTEHAELPRSMFFLMLLHTNYTQVK